MPLDIIRDAPMKIEIYNATRNVRIAPTIDTGDPMDQLRELADQMPEAGSQAVEFQCDQPFFDATGLGDDKSFGGIPIIVES